MTKTMKQTAFVAVLATLVVSGLFLSSNNAFAADHKAKPGDTVEASDGDSIEVDVSEEASDGKAPAPKAKKGADAKLKPAAVDAKVAPMDVEGTKKVEKAEQTPSKIMVDDFTEAKSTAFGFMSVSTLAKVCSSSRELKQNSRSSASPPPSLEP